MNRNLAALFAAASTAGLVACGGGGGGSSVAPPPPPPGPRGTLISTSTATTLSTTTIDGFNADASMAPVDPGEAATCDVSVRQIVYSTITPQGTPINASGGLLVPAGSGCSGAHPLLSMQHGTSTTSSFDGSDPNAPLTLAMAKYFTSHGYVVVVPDYLGYGVSTSLGYHPYVNAEADAAAVIDAIRATRAWFATSEGQASGAKLSSKLFLTGTSEGGYISMATQRTMERDFPAEFVITANVPTSGPYDLGTEVMTDLMTADSTDNSATGSATFLLTSYQDIYGDIYSSTTQVFRSPWSGTVEGLFPGVYGSATAAMKDCKIPFNIDTAPSPPMGSCSTEPLLQAQFVTDYENGNSGTPGGIARAHVEANGLLQSWKNVAPMTLCYGSLDPMAQTNALAAGTFFGIVPVDVQSTGPAFITSWMVANSTGSKDYHGQVEAPGCTAYARYAVFDTFVTPL
jgi:hypothetical protein